MSSEEKERFRLIYIQHAPYGVYEVIAGDGVYITLLRDPWRRFVSDYYHARRHRGHSFFQQAQAGAGLEDFVMHREEQGLTNPMTRMVSGRQAYPPFGPLPEAALEVAKKNIEASFIVAGTVERFDASLLLMKQRLDWGRVLYDRRNVGCNKPDRTVVDESVRERHAKSNGLDYELYAFVKERLETEIHAAGKRFLRAVRSFQWRNRWYQRAFDLARRTKRTLQGIGEAR